MDSSNAGIGARVRKLRNRRKLTQAQLGLLIGVSDKHISEIELGKTGITIDMQILLHDALHCSLDYLILGEEFSTIDSFIPDEALRLVHSSEEEKELFLKYVELYKTRR